MFETPVMGANHSLVEGVNEGLAVLHWSGSVHAQELVSLIDQVFTEEVEDNDELTEDEDAVAVLDHARQVFVEPLDLARAHH